MKGFNKRIASTFNALSLTGVSLVWGHMLGLITPWLLPVTILVLLAGYGSEIDTEVK